MSAVIEINCATGQVTERELTDEEIVQREADAVVAAEQQLLIDTKQATKDAARESAVAKLFALGLTDVEVQALVGA